MKTKTLPFLCCLLLTIGSNVTLVAADTVQYVSLCSTGLVTAPYPLTTNQLVVWLGAPKVTTSVTAGTALGSFQLTLGQTYTGLTNIFANVNSGIAYASFQITTPTSATAVATNCYLPANALVIPTSVTGPVAITMETSADLTTWTGCNPGTYGPNLGNQRFFRLKALAQ